MQLEGRGLLEFSLWLVFLTGFLALSVYDLRWFLLPDKIVFPLVGLAAVQAVVSSIYQKDWEVALTAASGAVVISGMFYVLYQLSNGKWIGGGDVKLGLVLGLLAGGLLPAFLVLFTASVAGLAASLPAVLRGKANNKTQIPFGPFLILGLVVVKLFGGDIIDWYAGLIYV
jgi:prepilin signal peptidase PulO-like enzyme (type II secretory pathway)